VQTTSELETAIVQAREQYDSLSPVYKDNLNRQRREGGIKLKNLPHHKGQVEFALKSHTDSIAKLKERLAEVELALDKAELKVDFVKCRDERRSLIAQIKTATEAKTTARNANKDNAELVHFRATARASEWMRINQVRGILGELQYEERQESDDKEIAEFEHAQSVAKSEAQVMGILDLSLYKD